MRGLDIPAVPPRMAKLIPNLGRGTHQRRRDVAEAALAHTVSNGVEAAYNRAVHFEARRDLMAAWARYLDGDAVAVLLPKKISN